MSGPAYPFIREIGGIFNSGASHSVLVSGEVHDLFFVDSRGYLPLVDFVLDHWGEIRSKILLVYELNGPLRFLHPEDRDKLSEAWMKWRTGLGAADWAVRRMLMTSKERAESETLESSLDSNLERAQGRPSVALELLRQLCICSRHQENGTPVLHEDLIILIEGADMLVPAGQVAQLSDADRHRIGVCRDWFSDPEFMDGSDSVLLITESASQVNDRVARLPQMLEVAVPAPSTEVRSHCIDWFNREREPVRHWGEGDELVQLTAGLSIHALLQMLSFASHRGTPLTPKDVVIKVEEHVKSQLGEDVVEFKKPSHTLDAVVGFSNLKRFIGNELIPRFRSREEDALPGAAVAGAIGSGKTFIFEAVAAEIDVVVLVLKGIRSKWFGETDLLFERLQRVLAALDKVLIFVDEADTQFGGVGKNTHPTERRLTGKIQAMMSDPRLRGQVIWLLMTARIHLLSPDIRRPGRVGDLIVPVLDPTDEDREEFVRWMAAPALGDTELTTDELHALRDATMGFSAAGFASLRSELKAKAIHSATGSLTVGDALAIVADQIPPNIAEVRRYQTLQALINCTRRSLLPDPKTTDEQRRAWREEIRALEARGIG
ncbi:MAG: ATP-binding protein [Myxococcota bacterium]